MIVDVQFALKYSKIKFVSKQNVVGITSALSALLDSRI